MEQTQPKTTLDPLTSLPSSQPKESPEELLKKALDARERVDLGPRQIQGTFGDYVNLAVTSGQKFNEQRALNQSGIELFGKGLLQTFTGVAGMALEGTGYILDAPRMLVNLAKGSEEAFEQNFISQLGSAVQDVGRELGTIYQTEKAQEGNLFGRFSDPTFIAQAAPSIFSALSFMVPGAGTAMTLAKVGKFLKLGQTGVKTLSAVGAGLASRHMESGLESVQNYQENYERLLGEINTDTGQPYTEEEAKYYASQRAAQLYKNSFMINVALDVLQWGSLIKPINFASRNLTKSIASLSDDASTPYLTKLKTVLKENPNLTVKKAAEKAKDSLLLQSITEGIEEYNTEFAKHVVNRNSMAIEAGRPEEVKGFLESYFSGDVVKFLAEDPTAQDAFVLGMLGGALFGGVGKLATNKEAKKIQEEGVRQAKIFQERSNRIKENFKSQISAILEGDEVKANEAFYQAIQEMAINGFVDPKTKDRYVGAVEDGTLDGVIEMYAATEYLTDEEIIELGLAENAEDAKLVKQEAKKAVEELNRVKKIYNKLADKNFGTDRDDLVRAYSAEQEYVNDYTERIIQDYGRKIEDLKTDQRYTSQAEGLNQAQLIYAEKKRKLEQLKAVREVLSETGESAKKKIGRYGYIYAANSIIPERSILRTVEQADADIKALEQDIAAYEGTEGLTKAQQDKANEFNKNLRESFKDFNIYETKKLGREYKLKEGKNFLSEFYKQPNLREFVRNVQRGEEELRKALYSFSIDEDRKENGFAIIDGNSYRIEKDDETNVYTARLVDRQLKDVPEAKKTEKDIAVEKEIEENLKQQKESLKEKDGKWSITVSAKDTNKEEEINKKIQTLEDERTEKLNAVFVDDPSLEQAEKENINLDYDKKIEKLKKDLEKATTEEVIDAETKEQAEAELEKRAEKEKIARLPQDFNVKRELKFESLQDLEKLSDSQFYNPEIILTEQQVKEKEERINKLLEQDKFDEAYTIIAEELYNSNYYDIGASFAEQITSILISNIQSKESLRDLNSVLDNSQNFIQSSSIGQIIKTSFFSRRAYLLKERDKEVEAFREVIQDNREELKETNQNIKELTKAIEAIEKAIKEEEVTPEDSLDTFINKESISSDEITAGLTFLSKFIKDQSKSVSNIVEDLKKELNRLEALKKDISKTLRSYKKLEEKFKDEIPRVLLESDFNTFKNEKEALSALTARKYSLTTSSLNALKRRVEEAEKEGKTARNLAEALLARLKTLDGAIEESIRAAEETFEELLKSGKLYSSDEKMLPSIVRIFAAKYNEKLSREQNKIADRTSPKIKQLEGLKVLYKNNLSREKLIKELDTKEYVKQLQEAVDRLKKILYAEDVYNRFYDAITEKLKKLESSKLSSTSQDDIDGDVFVRRADPKDVFIRTSGNQGSVKYGPSEDPDQYRFGRWISTTNVQETRDENGTLKVFKLKLIVVPEGSNTNTKGDAKITVSDEVRNKYPGKPLVYAAVVNEKGEYYKEDNTTTTEFNQDENIYTSMPQATYFVDGISKTYVLGNDPTQLTYIVNDDQLKKLYPPKKGETFNPTVARTQLDTDVKAYRKQHEDFLNSVVEAIENDEEIIIDVLGKSNGVQSEVDTSFDTDFEPLSQKFDKGAYANLSDKLRLVISKQDTIQISGVTYKIRKGTPLITDNSTGNLYKAYTRKVNDEDTENIINALSAIVKNLKLSNSILIRDSSKDISPYLNIIRNIIWAASVTKKSSKAPIQFRINSRNAAQISIDGKTYNLFKKEGNKAVKELNPVVIKKLKEYLADKRINLNRENLKLNSPDRQYTHSKIDKDGNITSETYNTYFDYLIETDTLLLKKSPGETTISYEGSERKVNHLTHYNQQLIFSQRRKQKEKGVISENQLLKAQQGEELDQQIIDALTEKVKSGIPLTETEKLAIDSLDVLENLRGDVKTLEDESIEYNVKNLSEKDIDKILTEGEKAELAFIVMKESMARGVNNPYKPSEYEKRLLELKKEKAVEKLKSSKKEKPAEKEVLKPAITEEIRSKIALIAITESGRSLQEKGRAFSPTEFDKRVLDIQEEYLKTGKLPGEEKETEEKKTEEKKLLKKDKKETDKGKRKVGTKTSTKTNKLQRTKFDLKYKRTEVQKQIDKITSRINISVTVLSKQEAAELLTKTTGQTYTADTVPFGFEQDGKAYVVGNDVFNADTVFHEVAHPIVTEILKKNTELFYKLFDELEKSPAGKKIIEEVEQKYAELNEGYLKGTFSIPMMAEIITTAIGQDAANLVYGRANKTLSQRIKEIWDSIVDFISGILNIELSPKDLSYKTTVRDLANLIAVRKIKMNVDIALSTGTAFQKAERAPVIKEGVPELFESNPELANKVYEALGLNTISEIKISNRLFNPDMAPDGYSKKIILRGKTIGEFALLDSGNEVHLSGALGARTELNEDQRGKGYGYKAYLELAKQVKAEGKVLVSDTDRTEDANRVWNKLVKEGYANKINDVYIIDNSKLSNNELAPQQKQQALQLYSQYLDTIFPDSKVKDIVYHFSNTNIEIPDKNKFSLSANINRRKEITLQM
jgi:hypothetical protein